MQRGEGDGDRSPLTTWISVILMFNILDHIEVDAKGRAHCPCCEAEGKKRKNLSVMETGAYKCFRGHTPEEIRAALGAEKPRVIPTNLANKPALSTAKAVEAAHRKLQREPDWKKGPSLNFWLRSRQIGDELINRHRLGLYISRVGDREVPSIGIPIPADASGDAFYIKKRVAPHLIDVHASSDYVPWKQWGIPPMVWFTHKPEDATQTWLCEGEWDAMLMGEMIRESGEAIAVACFTCGAGSVPDGEQLARLIGDTIVWYDLDKAGREGAAKVTNALGKGSHIATVPHGEAPQEGFDVTDAIFDGLGMEDFLKAAAAAEPWKAETKADIKSANVVRDRLIWNDELIDTAPDYTDWLIPDLLTQNELFLLAAGARTGKSLMSMTLTKAVASGGQFLGRPATQGTVLYVAIEDGAAKLKERQQAQGWDRGMPVVWLKKFKLSELPQLRQVAEEIEALRLVVIDTLSRVKDSNVSESSAEMSQILEPLQDMASELDVCIVLVHHTGKVNLDNAQAVDIFDTIRGSSAIRAVCRGSMVIAAGERDYRLVVENGWGKHDLKVLLDANTLEWKLLGKWNPVTNLTQRDQILDFLRKTGQSSIEQISEATGIPKKSLYEQLSRLQISEDANEKVVKEGKRRNYTYRLALFNTIQQLNSVLNSENSNPESDRGSIQQNNICGTPIVEIENEIENDSSKSCGIVEYSAETHTESESQLFNSYSTVEYKPTVEYKVGDWVEIQVSGMFYGNHALVEAIAEDEVTIRHPDWVVCQRHKPEDLKKVKV